MCGIVGFSGTENFNVTDIKMLMLYNETRGGDGCGIYNEGKISKFNKSGVESLHELNIVPERLFLGHMRKATYSSYKKEKHTHPLQQDDIIGIHNGSLTEHYKIANEIGMKHNEYDIDSEVLMKAISVDVTTLKRIKGSASILYIDIKTPNRLYAFRKNEERPLFRGNKEEGMYISSIQESLLMIGCNKESIKPFKTEYLYVIEDGKIIETRPMLTEVVKDKREVHNNYPARTNEYYKNLGDGTDGYINYDFNEEIGIGEFVKVAIQPKNKSIKLGEIYAVRAHSGMSSNTVSVYAVKKDGSLDIQSTYTIDKQCLINLGELKNGNLAISRVNGSNVKKGDLLYVTWSGWCGKGLREHKTCYDILGNIDPKKDVGRNQEDFTTQWEFFTNRLCPFDINLAKALFKQDKRKFLGEYLLKNKHITVIEYETIMGITQVPENNIEVIPNEDEADAQDGADAQELDPIEEAAIKTEVIPKMWIPVGKMYDEIEECISLIKEVGSSLYSEMSRDSFSPHETNLLLSIQALEDINKAIYERAIK